MIKYLKIGLLIYTLALPALTLYSQNHKPNIKFVYISKTTEEFSPIIDVYLEIDNELIYVKREFVYNIYETKNENENIIASCSGWNAGSGFNIYAIIFENQIEIYREDFGEGIDNVEPEFIKKIYFSKLTNGKDYSNFIKTNK